MVKPPRLNPRERIGWSLGALIIYALFGWSLVVTVAEGAR